MGSFFFQNFWINSEIALWLVLRNTRPMNRTLKKVWLKIVDATFDFILNKIFKVLFGVTRLSLDWGIIYFGVFSKRRHLVVTWRENIFIHLKLENSNKSQACFVFGRFTITSQHFKDWIFGSWITNFNNEVSTEKDIAVVSVFERETFKGKFLFFVGSPYKKKFNVSVKWNHFEISLYCVTKEPRPGARRGGLTEPQ